VQNFTTCVRFEVKFVIIIIFWIYRHQTLQKPALRFFYVPDDFKNKIKESKYTHLQGIFLTQSVSLSEWKRFLIEYWMPYIGFPHSRAPKLWGRLFLRRDWKPNWNTSAEDFHGQIEWFCGCKVYVSLCRRQRKEHAPQCLIGALECQFYWNEVDH
jgi:hypothetical protein